MEPCPGDCGPRRGVVIETSHTVHSRVAGRMLRLSVVAAGHEPRILISAGDDAGSIIGGFVGLREIRRVARAIATGRAKTFVGLRGWGAMPGGRLSFEQDDDEVFFVATPVTGAPRLFGPVPTAAVAAMCRDLVGWNRLLARAAGPVAAVAP